MNIFRSNRALPGVTVALALSSAVIIPAYAWDPARIHQPGTYEAIMYAKMPGVFGPHLVVPAGQPERRAAPGSFEAIMEAKLPGIYGARTGAFAAMEGTKLGEGTAKASRCPNAFAPGSFEALMHAKMPAIYRAPSCR